MPGERSRSGLRTRSTEFSAYLKDAARFRLLVIGDGVAAASHPLPDEGEITIGRSSGASVRIDHASISRRHVVLRMGVQITVEDLGSRNGTRVGERRLEPGQAVEVQPGEMIEVGKVTVTVQRAGAAGRPRRLWAHGYFEGRLEDECARALRAGGELAMVRIDLAAGGQAAIALEVFAEELAPDDLVAHYGPREFELLLCDVAPSEAERVASRVAARLSSGGAPARYGLACFPRDGRTPEALVQRACEAVRGEPAGRPEEGALIVRSPAMARLHQLLERVAAGSINVLVTGETGVGKELVAAELHRLSPRAARPLVRLNCAALPEALLENELFGHERGAFTGALSAKPGLFETAQGGTILLDEIGELPLATQAKLLRVIEERKVLRVGALKPRAIDVRFVAATNRDLEAESLLHTFRQDLYFRLSGVTLLVPPLRERREEIEPLARAFVGEACRAAGRSRPPRLTPSAVALLERYGWPGNVRELRNLMERAVLLCAGAEIGPELLPVEKMGATLPPADRAAVWEPPTDQSPVGAARAAPGSRSLDGAEPISIEGGRPPPPGLSPAELAERARIAAALERCAGNQSAAARILGMPRRTLVLRLDQYDLPRPRKGSGA
jgi:DNA-binding NtrC family response regulator